MFSKGKTVPGSHNKGPEAQIGVPQCWLLPQALYSSFLLRPLQGFLQHQPRMQGSEAHQGQGQSSGGRGTRGRPWVIPLTYILVALEFTCLFMRFSILPYLSRRLGLDAVTFGYLQTTFGLLQLLGGPMFGRYQWAETFRGPHPSVSQAHPSEDMGWVMPNSKTSRWAPPGRQQHRRAVAPLGLDHTPAPR
ncbi:hypothetical protein MC885_007847, partial [Smutsia gigantea]